MAQKFNCPWFISWVYRSTTNVMCNYAIAYRRSIAHCKYRVFMLHVPFFICRYLFLNIQVPFSTRQQAIHGTVLFTPDLLTPHTAFSSLPANVPIFWNVSTYFFYPCAHSVVASSTRCHLNRRNLNTYRETRPPSWGNGTWQVPSQLSHSEKSCRKGRRNRHVIREFLGNPTSIYKLTNHVSV